MYKTNIIQFGYDFFLDKNEFIFYPYLRIYRIPISLGHISPAGDLLLFFVFTQALT